MCLFRVQLELKILYLDTHCLSLEIIYKHVWVTRNLPSLFDSSVQSIIHLRMYIDQANVQPDYTSGLYAIIDYYFP